MKTENTTTNLYERITKWNLERNGLEFDPALEARMLSEEAKEFWEATDLAHMLQEYSDFRFVMTGTRAKYFSESYTGHMTLMGSHEGWQDLESWMNDCLDVMRSRVKRRLQDHGIVPPTDIFTKALRFVVEANEAKGTQKVNGKVVKGDNYQSPLPRIQAELDYLMAHGPKGRV